MVVERTFFLLFIRNMRLVHYHIISALSNLLAFLKNKPEVNLSSEQTSALPQTHKEHFYQKKCFFFAKPGFTRHSLVTDSALWQCRDLVRSDGSRRFFWNTGVQNSLPCDGKQLKPRGVMGTSHKNWEGPPWGEKKKRKKRTKDKKTFLRGQNFMVKMSFLISYHLQLLLWKIWS